jgi:hypothetical protein
MISNVLKGRLAADAVAVVAEDRGADRPSREAAELRAERQEDADVRVAAGEEQLGEDEGGCRAVEEEVVPLDRGADDGRHHRPPALRPPEHVLGHNRVDRRHRLLLGCGGG